MEKITSTEIRVDRNVAYNITDFSKLDEDASLVKSLIYYFCHTYQNNFFGYGIFDPAHFGKLLNYSTNYLHATVDNPVQLQNKTIEEINSLKIAEKEHPSQRIFDSRIENALYLLSTQAISFSNDGRVREFDNDTGYYFRKIKSMVFIEELEIVFTRPKSGRGKEKILYNYQLNKEFIKNLSNFYLKANAQSFIKLRKSNFDDLYLHLVTAKANLATQNIYEYRPKFDNLWSILGKHRNEKREQKRALKNAILKIQKETELEFDIQWERSPNSKFAYQPVFKFKNDYKNSNEKEEAIKIERRQIFSQNLIHELLEIMKKVQASKYHSRKREEHFLSWIRNNKINLREKGLAYEQAQLKTYLKLPKNIDYYKSSFFNNIKENSTFEEIFDCIKLDNNFPKQEYITTL